MENRIYPTIKNSILLCLLFCGILLGLGIISEIIKPIFTISDDSLFDEISSALYSIISFGTVLVIGFKKTKRNFNEVFKFNRVSLFLWFAVIVFMIGYIIVESELNNLLLYILPIPENIRNFFDVPIPEQNISIAIIGMVVIPGFAEELLFRGLILDGLKNNYSKKKAILISALLFAIIHLNPLNLIFYFFFGAFAAWICVNTNSILLCVYMHLFNNAVVVAAAKIKNYIPIRGFNTNTVTSIEFQPIWFNVIGLIALVSGILMLKQGFKKAKINARWEAPALKRG